MHSWIWCVSGPPGSGNIWTDVLGNSTRSQKEQHSGQVGASSEQSHGFSSTAQERSLFIWHGQRDIGSWAAEPWTGEAGRVCREKLTLCSGELPADGCSLHHSSCTSSLQWPLSWDLLISCRFHPPPEPGEGNQADATET